jgi:hypothetical protein
VEQALSEHEVMVTTAVSMLVLVSSPPVAGLVSAGAAEVLSPSVNGQ